MILPSLPLIDGALFIDNSGWIENLATCDRRLEYSQLHKRISSAESSALNFGSAMHLALELRYLTQGTSSVDPLFYDDVGQVLSAYFDQHPAPIGEYRDLNWSIEIVKKYVSKYDIEQFNLLEYDKPVDCKHCNSEDSTYPKDGISCPFCSGTGHQSLMVELPFALHLFDYSYMPRGETHGFVIPIFYSGRIDLPLLRGNQLFVLDHKTTSMLGANFWEEKKMSAQAKGYCWSFQQLTGRKVDGYAINAIRTKQPPDSVTNPTSKRKTDKTPTVDKWWDETLQREFYLLSDGELDEWKANTISLVREFFWHYINDFMPQKTSWCVSKFGKCPYLEVCTTFPKEDRLFMLQSGNFQDNIWSPLNQPSQPKVIQ